MPRPRLGRDVERAKQLRSVMSLPERLLWSQLRNSPDGVRFRRQHPVGSYVLDFYCPTARLAIEIDGIAHDMGNRPTRDTERDHWLADQGFEVVRILAKDVLDDPEEVAVMLLTLCQSRRTPPSA